MLQNMPIFSKLTTDKLDLVMRIAIRRTYAKNVVIAHEGDPLESFYIILSGSIKVFLSDRCGKEMTLDILKPCDYTGELLLLDDACHSASLVTLETVCVAAIRKKNFKTLLYQLPEIGDCLLLDQINKVQFLTEKVRNFALYDVYGRLVKILLSMANSNDGCLRIEEKITQKELASRVGASPKMVARILKNLCDGGYITYQNKRISIEKRFPENY